MAANSQWPSPSTRALVEQFGFEYDYRADVELPEPRRHVNIREEKHYNPSSKVQEIRAALKRGDVVEPPIITQDGYYVDGNTRGTAYQKNGVSRAHAVVLRATYEGANELDERNMRGLGAALNIRHGKGLDDRERAGAVRQMLNDPDLSQERVAELLGVPPRLVAQIKNEINGRERVERVLGKETNGDLPAAVAREFGPALESWHDEPTRAVASLVVDAALNAKETRELVRRVGAEPSDEAAVAVVEQERKTYGPTIRRRRTMGNGRGVPSWIRGKRIVGQLLNLVEPGRLVIPGQRTEEWSELLNRCSQMCAQAAEMQGQEVLFEDE